MTALVPGDVSHVAPVVPAGNSPLRHTVELNGVEYGIVLKDYRHQGVESTREGITAHDGDPSEALFDHSGTWWRHRFDWTHGAGQTFGDFLAESSDHQFYLSSDINPWRPGMLELLPVMTVAYNPGGFPTFNQILNLSGDVNVLVSPGAAPSLISDGGTRFTTFTTLIAANDIIGATTDGVLVYAFSQTKVYRVDPNAVTSTNVGVTVTGLSADQRYTGLFVIGNRLLAFRHHILVEVGAAGAETVIRTMPVGFNWTVAFAVGSLIYVGGCGDWDITNHSGNQSQLYTLTTSSTGTLVIGPEAAPFGVGESLLGAVTHAGLVVLATSAGFRVGQPSGAGTLTYGPVFGMLGHETFRPSTPDNIGIDIAYNTTQLVASDGYVWAAITPRTIGSASDLIIRMDLSTFTDPLVPAYALDIHPGTPPRAAAFQHIQCLAARGDGKYPYVLAYEPFAYTDVWGVADPITATTHPVASGSIQSGRLYFGTVEQKRLTSLVVKFGDAGLGAGESVTIAVYNQDGTSIATATENTVSAVGMTVDLAGTLVDWASVTVTLNGPGTSTPVITSWEIRGYPVPTTTEQWLVPLIVNSVDRLGPGQGQDRSFDPMTTCIAIEDLWRTKATITYREGARSRRVRIDNFQITGTRWIEDGDYLEAIVLVQLLSA